MSIEFNRLDLEKLTTDAEKGHGCALREAITDLGLEERFRVLKEIELNNAKHRLNDPSVGKLLVYGGTSDLQVFSSSDMQISLNLQNQHKLLSDPLYIDKLDLRKFTHRDTCKDLNK